LLSAVYSPLHPRSTSLNQSHGKESDSRWVEFVALREFQLDFDELASFDYRETVHAYALPIPISLSHVLWTFKPRVSRVGVDEFSLSLFGPGHPLDEKEKREIHFPGLRPPSDAVVTIVIISKTSTDQELLTLESSEDGRVFSSRHFCEHELSELTIAKKLLVRVHICVPRSYFSLKSIIDLEPKLSVPARIAVESILRGEWLPESDLEITTPNIRRGGIVVRAPVYHVRRSAFDKAGPSIQVCLGCCCLLLLMFCKTRLF
ncbi:hypothetical protein PMAYCL1PPCAC_01257, partial [Pristionchus mayeri]